jgi:dephospho-CoA kinase
MADANFEQRVLVGLTGSIGAGKSTVAAIFEREGIPVLRADAIAKELMERDPEMRAQLIEAFGDDAYVGTTLNRPYLAEKIFGDRDKLELMNMIVHPRTIAEQGKRASQLFAAGAHVVACEAALIFESGGEGRFDYIVVVDAKEDVRLKRAAERDNTSIDEARRRDAMQISAQRKVEMADFVIRNDGDTKELEEATTFIASLLKKLPPRHAIERDDEPEEPDNGHAENNGF